jgi:hypothetical protein
MATPIFMDLSNLLRREADISSAKSISYETVQLLRKKHSALRMYLFFMAALLVAYFLLSACIAVILGDSPVVLFAIVPAWLVLMIIPFGGAWLFAALAIRRKPVAAIIVALAMTPIHLCCMIEGILNSWSLLTAVPSFWDRLANEPKHDAEQIVHLWACAVFFLLDIILIAALILSLLRRRHDYIHLA